MARIVEDAFVWTYTGSTGTAKAHRITTEAERISVFFAGSFGSSATGSTAATASVSLQGTFGSSNGPYVELSTAVSTLSHPNSAVLLQFQGPLEWVRPRISAMSASTETVTCRLFAN